MYECASPSFDLIYDRSIINVQWFSVDYHTQHF